MAPKSKATAAKAKAAAAPAAEPAVAQEEPAKRIKKEPLCVAGRTGKALANAVGGPVFSDLVIVAARFHVLITTELVCCVRPGCASSKLISGPLATRRMRKRLRVCVCVCVDVSVLCLAKVQYQVNRAPSWVKDIYLNKVKYSKALGATDRATFWRT